MVADSDLLWIGHIFTAFFGLGEMALCIIKPNCPAPASEEFVD